MSLSFHEWLASKYYLSAAEKPFFGKRRIRFGPLVTLQSFMFSAGALIGWARRDRLPSLWRAFTADGDVGMSDEELREHNVQSASFLTPLCEPHAPRSFYDLAARWFFPELSESQALTAIAERASDKISERQALEELQPAVWASLGLGAIHPDVVERIVDNQNQWAGDPERIRFAQLAGWEPPEPMGIEAMAQEMLVELLAFASEQRPGLIEPLGLRL